MLHMNALTLRQLRALRAVATQGTLTAAAGDLGLSPPAVHGQIRTLEDLVGSPLLRRGAHGNFVPTHEGQALLDAESQINIALETCARRVSALQGGQTGSVALGVIATGKYFAPRLVARLRRAFADIEVTLRIGSRDQMLLALAGNAVDMVVLGRPPRNMPVVADPIGPHPYIIIAPPDHPLTRSDPAMPADLFSETFLMREEGSGTHILTTRFLDRIGDGILWRAIEMGSNETIKQAVIAGLGIALISAHTVTEELHSGRLASIRAIGLPIQRTWYLIRRQDGEMGPAARRVHDHIRALSGSFLPQ
ncbi:LysR family transcriptional regulator [Paracoccus sp. DMF-8]|uniref:LysR family transcriptional regulator n=1 Tax=Paracoccus sp. DMF-8 TaxID=3019445 RepID=UPI0023E8BC7D|nr:LysR family transcriptional regulator [Paracoccus sp. DMF-8]MDF3606976.1 LysR family transcriptional regulator [Paracoccus sp. DMF-8]